MPNLLPRFAVVCSAGLAMAVASSQAAFIEESPGARREEAGEWMAVGGKGKIVAAIVARALARESAKASSAPSSGSTEAVDLAAGEAPRPPVAAPVTPQRRKWLEKEVPARKAGLEKSYAALAKRREALKPGDQPATDQFNRDAARYAEQLTELRKLNTELETAKSQPPAPTPAATGKGGTQKARSGG